MTGDDRQDPARPDRIERFRNEKVMQRQFDATMFQPDIGEWRIADHGIERPFGQLRIAEILDPDLMGRMFEACDPARDRIEFDADAPHARRCLGQEIPGAAARLQHCAIPRHAQIGQSGVHRLHHHGRGVERIECGAFGRIVFVGGEK